MDIAKDGFVAYLNERIHHRHYDVSVTDVLVSEFSSLDTVGFKKDVLHAMLKADPNLAPSSIGETFAECYLEDYGDSRIPYPHRRDVKNSRSEPAGTDIVGFFYADGSTMFLFGETKLSGEDRRPPRVVMGKNGLHAQMNAIISCKKKRNLLIRWLLMHASPEDRTDCISAYARYIRDEFKVVGVLIRTTKHDPRDVKPLHDKMSAKSCERLEILALYIPITLDTFVSEVTMQ